MEDVEFYERQLNSQQEVLDLAKNSINALEERVRGTYLLDFFYVIYVFICIHIHIYI